MKIYVASSWRNKLQPKIVDMLRTLGYEVYDFKDPSKSFKWSDIDEIDCRPKHEIRLGVTHA